MQIKRSDKFGKIRYAGFDGDARVTQWLVSPSAVQHQFAGRVREGRVDPRGLDQKMRSSIKEELIDLGFEYDILDDGLTKAEKLAFTLKAMRDQQVPQATRARFAQIATCRPEVDAGWVLD